MRGPHHHLIIGDGASAAALAETLVLTSGDQLTILGANAGQFGKGMAYADHPSAAPWRYAYLLNSPSGAFGESFVEWFEANWGDIRSRIAAYQPRWLDFAADHLDAGDFGAVFAPRAVFGDYLAEIGQGILAMHAEAGVRVQQRTALATDLAKDEHGFRITLATGEVIRADRVDVATGGPSPQRFGADSGPTAFTTLYGNEQTIAEVLRPGQEVTCLGGNAAMLDVLRLMQSVMDEQDIRLRVITRGSKPEQLIWARPRKEPVTPKLTGPYRDADALLAAVDAEIAAFRAKGASMAELRPGYLGWAAERGLETLLPSLSERRKVMPQLERRFRRATHNSLADYARLQAAGQIVEEHGEITWVYAETERKTRIRLKRAGTRTNEEITTSVVINTSGPGDQLAMDLLTSGLIRNGWLRMNETKTGLIVGPGLETEVEGLRYLSPAVTEIGAEVLAFPLEDVSALAARAKAANQIAIYERFQS